MAKTVSSRPIGLAMFSYTLNSAQLMWRRHCVMRLQQSRQPYSMKRKPLSTNGMHGFHRVLQRSWCNRQQ